MVDRWYPSQFQRSGIARKCWNDVVIKEARNLLPIARDRRNEWQLTYNISYQEKIAWASIDRFLSNSIDRVSWRDTHLISTDNSSRRGDDLLRSFQFIFLVVIQRPRIANSQPQYSQAFPTKHEKATNSTNSTSSPDIENQGSTSYQSPIRLGSSLSLHSLFPLFPSSQSGSVCFRPNHVRRSH